MSIQKMRKGESKRSDGRYMYRYTDSNGKRHAVYAKTLNELRVIEMRLDRDKRELKNYIQGDATVNFTYDRYMSLKTNLKQNTRSNYNYFYDKYVRDGFGKKSLKDIRFSVVKDFYLSLMENGLSISSVDSIQCLLHPVFQLAVRDEIIRVNPTDGVMAELKKNNGKNKGIRHALTLSQQRAFLNYIARSPVYYHWLPLFAYMFGTGCRVGEVVGIRWEDINFEKKLITIDHSLIYMMDENRKAVWHVSTPKTEAGIRVIPLLDEVAEALEEERKNQEETGIINTDVIDGMSGFVFSNRFGKALIPSSINRAIRRISEAYNTEETVKAVREKREPEIIPHFSAHHIRHTFATRLCEHETNLKVIQSIMGHANIETTMDIYAEATRERNAETAKKINNSETFF